MVVREGTKGYPLRFPPGLKGKAENVAGPKNLNAWVVGLIERAVARHGTGAAPTRAEILEELANYNGNPDRLLADILEAYLQGADPTLQIAAAIYAIGLEHPVKKGDAE